MTAEEKFRDEMLAEIGLAFYVGSRKRFLQDREELIRAILLPVEYIHAQRDLVATLSQYTAIVRTVIKTIRQHGKPDPRRRFSLYFLKCMQTHLQHHGEDYLKAAKSISNLSVTGARSIRQMEAIEITGTLEKVRRFYASKAGRKRAKQLAAIHPELFAFLIAVGLAIMGAMNADFELSKTWN